MNLIFTKTKDLKDHLGFIDANIKFDNFKADLITATREVSETISKEVYNFVFTQFQANITNTSPNFDLLMATQNAIASRAYQYYAKKGDVSHTGDGRKMRNEEHQKNAFEWMIKDNDNALEQSYYRALNDLLLLLDEMQLSQWINSEEYINRNKVFVNKLKHFESYYPIKSLLIYQMILPGLIQCETKYIIPRITKAKYDQLKNAPTQDDVFLIELIKEATIFFALAEKIHTLSINILPDGVLQEFRSEAVGLSATKVPQLLEKEKAIQSFRNTYINCFADIEKEVSKLQVVQNEPVNLDDILPTNINKVTNKFFT